MGLKGTVLFVQGVEHTPDSRLDCLMRTNRHNFVRPAECKMMSISRYPVDSVIYPMSLQGPFLAFEESEAQRGKCY